MRGMTVPGRTAMPLFRLARWTLSCALAAVLGSAGAADMSALTEAEVTHLLGYLERSACQFGRNGEWHNAKDAAKHLNDKKAYLVNQGSIASAEAFIAKAASKSSMSGSPYLVQCPGVPVAESGPWLTAELARFRQLHKK